MTLPRRRARRNPTPTPPPRASMRAGGQRAQPAGTPRAAQTGRAAIAQTADLVGVPVLAGDIDPEDTSSTAEQPDPAEGSTGAETGAGADDAAAAAGDTSDEATSSTGAAQDAPAGAGTRAAADATVAAAGTTALTVTSGADSGPGTLREALAAVEDIPGQHTITIDPSVADITLDSGLTVRGSVTLAGAGATRVEGTWSGWDALLTVAGGLQDAATVTMAGLTLAAPTDDALAVSASSGEGPLAALTLTDIAVEGGSGVAISDLTGSVTLDGITMHDARSLLVSSVAGTVRIGDLTAEGIEQVSVSGADDVVLRDADVDATTISVDGVAGDLLLEDVHIDALSVNEPWLTSYVEIHDVAGDVTLRSVSHRGGGAHYIATVGGSLTLTDYRIDRGDAESQMDGVMVYEVSGDIVVDGFVAEGFTSTALSLDASPEGATDQQVSVTGSTFVGAAGQDLPIGLRIADTGAGGVEITDVQMTQMIYGVELDRTGPATISDSELTGQVNPYFAYGHGIRTTTVRGAVTLRDLQITEFSTGLGLETDSDSGPVLVERVQVETLQQALLAGISLHGEAMDVHIVDSGVRVTGYQTLQTAEWNQAGAGLLIERSTFELVSAEQLWGDAMELNMLGPVEITNSTLVADVSDPEAVEEAPALVSFRADGPDAGLSIRHSTMVGATALTTSGAASVPVTVDSSVLDATIDSSAVQAWGPPVTLTRSAVACDADRLGQYGSEVVLGEGNLLGLDDADLALGPLQDNGGLTRTMLPLTGSVLIDAAGDPTGTTPATDQRGSDRLQGSALDIGAVEVARTVVTIVPEVIVVGGSTATLTLTRTGDDLDEALTVLLDSQDGTAVAGTDYEPLAAVAVTFPAGAATVEVPLVTIAVPDGGAVDLLVLVTAPDRPGVVADGTSATVRIEHPEAPVVEPPGSGSDSDGDGDGDGDGTPDPGPTDPTDPAGTTPGDATDAGAAGTGDDPAADAPSSGGALAVTGSAALLLAALAAVLLGTGATFVVLRRRRAGAR